MDNKDLYNKYKDMILYLFFGICTTIVNIMIYWIAAHPLNCGMMFSTILAWIAAVLFAYITNRKWVFHSQVVGVDDILKEASSFFACRIATGLIDGGCMLFFAQIIGFDDVMIKVASNILVIILNYIGSKFLIFRSKDGL